MPETATADEAIDAIDYARYESDPTYKAGVDDAEREGATLVQALRERIRSYESGLNEAGRFVDEVGKLLCDAGCPVAVVPIERVRYAARRLVEERPISDERAAKIGVIIDNVRSVVGERWDITHPLAYAYSAMRDIEAVLRRGSNLGRDDGPYQAAHKIADGGRRDNLIDEWLYTRDGATRVRQDTLVALIVAAIETEVARATEYKTRLLVEVANAMTGLDVGGREGGSGRRSMVPGGGCDDEAQFADLFSRITTTLRGRKA